MVNSGFYTATADNLTDYCKRAIVLGDAAAFDSEFSKYKCAAGSDTCCPAWGLMYSKDQCSSRTSNACQPSGECVTATDNCYMAYRTSAAGGAPLCPANCDKILYNNTVGSYQPVQENGRGMLCYNSTLWQMCLGAPDERACGGVQDSMQNHLCAFKQSCSPPPLTEFDCNEDADQCCLSSTTVTFGNAQAAQCGASTVAGGLKCKVSHTCVQVQDPCKQYTTPWDCSAQAQCTFMPNGNSNSNFGATCMSIEDPCPTSSADTCEQQQVLLGTHFVSRCRLIDRCKTNFCDASADSCCTLSNDYAQCRAAPTGCADDNVCVPSIDECKSLSGSSCQGYCAWNSTSSRCTLDIAQHPCSAIKDPYTCTTSDQQCLLVPLCISKCKTCNRCLTDAYTNVVVRALATDPATNGPSAAAKIFSDWYGKLVCWNAVHCGQKCIGAMLLPLEMRSVMLLQRS
jgi:hypothetical protein